MNSVDKLCQHPYADFTLMDVSREAAKWTGRKRKEARRLNKKVKGLIWPHDFIPREKVK
jgi:hypothetical protein